VKLKYSKAYYKI